MTENCHLNNQDALWAALVRLSKKKTSDTPPPELASK